MYVCMYTERERYMYRYWTRLFCNQEALLHWWNHTTSWFTFQLIFWLNKLSSQCLLNPFLKSPKYSLLHPNNYGVPCCNHTKRCGKPMVCLGIGSTHSGFSTWPISPLLTGWSSRALFNPHTAAREKPRLCPHQGENSNCWWLYKCKSHVFDVQGLIHHVSCLTHHVFTVKSPSRWHIWPIFTVSPRCFETPTAPLPASAPGPQLLGSSRGLGTHHPRDACDVRPDGKCFPLMVFPPICWKFRICWLGKLYMCKLTNMYIYISISTVSMCFLFRSPKKTENLYMCFANEYLGTKFLAVCFVFSGKNM